MKEEDGGWESQCCNCGTKIWQMAKRRQKRFCSDKCRSSYWYAHPELMNRNGQETQECAQCGRRIESYRSSGRKYCSHECYVRDRFEREPIAAAEAEAFYTSMEEVPPEPRFEEAMNLDELSEERLEPPIRPVFPVRIAGANEKLRPRRLYLLSGGTKFQGKYDHFSGLIPEASQEGLLDGDVYVFCNAQRTQLSVLQWQGDGFALFFKRTEYERYPWPRARESKFIEIAVIDLRLLLEIPGLLRRLSGQQTE